MIPVIACILGPLGSMMVIPLKTRKRVESGFLKYGESWKYGSCAFRRHSLLPISSFTSVQARGIGNPPSHRPCGIQ